MNKFSQINVAIIGCGIFGAEIAIKLKSLGFIVNIFEAKNDILSGASANNQNRLHLGFHYPRDKETALQSIRGFKNFKKKYYESIQDNFLNAYFISNENSLTNQSEYLNFCDLLDLPFKKIFSKDFPVEIIGADFGILCSEVVYDCEILKYLIWKKLRNNSVQVQLNRRIVKIQEINKKYSLRLDDNSEVFADIVINASYSDINRLTEQLGFNVFERLFEYTAVPIVKIDGIPKVGITIMDGPFMSLLPYGKSNNFLLYSVDHSVIARNVDIQINSDWLTPEKSPFANVDKSHFFKNMISFCQEFIPTLKFAKILGFLESPRMVKAYSENNDERQSKITDYGGTYFTVMAGKIDHSIWVAEEISLRLQSLIK